MGRRRLTGLWLIAAAVLVSTAGCGYATSSTAGSGRIAVVAAENFWGSIAVQLGGAHVTVTSIIANPNIDPHAYEATPADGRTVATSQYMVINGAGYDPWAPKLASANPSPDRKVLTVADLAGRTVGDNPHMWYDPDIVLRVVDQVTADYKSLDPADSGYFDQQNLAFKTVALAHYNQIRAAIKADYSGIAVGATESIFVDLAKDLGLDLITPSDYMKAISEGNDPTSADKATFDAQVNHKQIKMLVINKQNSTPDIQTLVDKANAKGIPVVEFTETPDPASDTFQQWQGDQLDALRAALAKATGH